MSLIIPIHGDISMRLVEPHRAPEIYALVQEHRDYLQQWLPWPNPIQSLEDCYRSIDQLLIEFANRKSLVLSIMQGDQIIGGTGWNHWQTGADYGSTYERGSADIGYWLLPGHQGKGIVSACVCTLTAMGFEEYGMFRLTIRAEPENERSKAVARRCGYVEEGVMRHVGRYHGRMVSHHLFAAYADTWAAPEGAGIHEGSR